jgi:hypothetical protein
MNSRYNIEEWAAATTLGRQVFNFNYRMLGKELKGWKLLKAVTMQEGRDVTEKVYIWQSKSAPGSEMIRISITERHHWRHAQESLAEQLSQSTRPDIPQGTKKLATVGDINFVGREPQSDIPAAVSFVRGNMCVSVSSVGEKNVDVSQVAATLDRALSERPPESEVKKGRVRESVRTAAAAVADESNVLIDNLPEAAPPDGWLKVIVPDGEVRREDDTLIYVPSQAGDKSIATFSVESGK